MHDAKHTEKRFAEVVFALPMDQAYTYAVPETLSRSIQVGMRVEAPLKNRITTGYVVALKAACDLESVKSICALPENYPVFSEDMLALCRWVADYYCCSWGEALQTALPAGLRRNSDIRYHLVPEQVHQGPFSAKQKKIVSALFSKGPQYESQLRKATEEKNIKDGLVRLVQRGVLRAEHRLTRQTTSLRKELYVRLNPDMALDEQAVEKLQQKAPRQAAIYLDLLHQGGEHAATTIYAKHKASLATLRALEKRGLLLGERRELYRRPAHSKGHHASEKLKLNAEQQATLDAIATAMDAARFQTFLLQGITGSGKTEVYLQAIEHTLRLGKNAIILVPEISLTPQTVGRFFARFQEKIAVLHSGLSLGERYDEWRRTLRGEVRIVVGARSAIFAPMPKLGIIVVDEEHDSSYKQNETPRYHARDVAILRAQRNNAVCVLGSATPSMESYHNSETGKSVRLSLLKRATNAPLPEVRVLDMRKESKAAGQVLLTQTLEEAIHDRITRKEQVILLLNRRGFAPFVLCPQCGWIAECADCNVSMTYHSSGGVLRCHYCGMQDAKPQCCGKCGFQPLIYLGAGTQKVEEYLMRTFADCRVERMDADTTSGKGGHAKILGRFAKGEIDMLIGTQMLAKGHDYPGVTLVGVINADTGLSMPDFRAAESVFQLLTQVAGRAGRGDKSGEVIIQTYRPNHYAIQCAAMHDYQAFYAREIESRKESGYPPFRRMVSCAIESEDPLQAEREVVRLRRIIHETLEPGHFGAATVLGPAPAAIRRVKKKYRWHIGILGRSPKRINLLTRSIREQYQALSPQDVELKIDLDPYGLY